MPIPRSLPPLGGQTPVQPCDSSSFRASSLSEGGDCAGLVRAYTPAFDASARGQVRLLERVYWLVDIRELTGTKHVVETGRGCRTAVSSECEIPDLRWLPAYVISVDGNRRGVSVGGSSGGGGGSSASKSRVSVKVLGFVAHMESCTMRVTDPRLLFRHAIREGQAAVDDDGAVEEEQKADVTTEEQSVDSHSRGEWVECPASGLRAQGVAAEPCFLCHRVGDEDGQAACGALLAYAPAVPRGDHVEPTRLWVHRQCLMWSPQTTYGGIIHWADGKFYHLDRLYSYSRTRRKQRFLFKCRQCGQVGATIGCHDGGPHHYGVYHFRCALETGWVPGPTPCMLGCTGKCFFCPSHRGDGGGGSSGDLSVASSSSEASPRGRRKRPAAAGPTRLPAAVEKALNGASDHDEELARELQRQLTGLRSKRSRRPAETTPSFCEEQAQPQMLVTATATVADAKQQRAGSPRGKPAPPPPTAPTGATREGRKRQRDPADAQQLEPPESQHPKMTQHVPHRDEPANTLSGSKGDPELESAAETTDNNPPADLSKAVSDDMVDANQQICLTQPLTIWHADTDNTAKNPVNSPEDESNASEPSREADIDGTNGDNDTGHTDWRKYRRMRQDTPTDLSQDARVATGSKKASIVSEPIASIKFGLPVAPVPDVSQHWLEPDANGLDTAISTESPDTQEEATRNAAAATVAAETAACDATLKQLRAALRSAERSRKVVLSKLRMRQREDVHAHRQELAQGLQQMLAKFDGKQCVGISDLYCWRDSTLSAMCCISALTLTLAMCCAQTRR
jgi:hypothetical protein